MALFKRGFAKYLESGHYADCVVVCGSQEYRVHRVLLAFSSEFFSRLLQGEWKESSAQHIEIKYPDPEGVFPEVLRFMYVGAVHLTDQNCIPLLAMADHFLMTNLKRVSSEYVLKNITRDNAIDILRRAVGFGVQDIVDKCINCVAKNFCNITRPDYDFLPHPIFLLLLRHPFLAVKDEWALYQLVCKYAKAHPDLSTPHVQALMETIRFRWMSYEQIAVVETNPVVPRQLIVEALMVRLKQHEIPEDPTDDEPANPRLKKRVSAGLEFEYQHDFDDKGIIFFIATNSGKAPWVNPHAQGFVKVTASSIERGHPLDLVSREPSELWTKDVPASWFMIDLGKGRLVMPSHYTLRHGGNYKADSLRTWDLQGSVEGQTWAVLKRHNNDKSLNSNFATHTWPLTGITRAFRFFRILQTGRNSNSHNFLVCSGFEVYGNLYEPADF